MSRSHRIAFDQGAPGRCTASLRSSRLPLPQAARSTCLVGHHPPHDAPRARARDGEILAGDRQRQRRRGSASAWQDRWRSQRSPSGPPARTRAARPHDLDAARAAPPWQRACRRYRRRRSSSGAPRRSTVVARHQRDDGARRFFSRQALDDQRARPYPVRRDRSAAAPAQPASSRRNAAAPDFRLRQPDARGHAAPCAGTRRTCGSLSTISTVCRGPLDAVALAPGPAVMPRLPIDAGGGGSGAARCRRGSEKLMRIVGPGTDPGGGRATMRPPLRFDEAAADRQGRGPMPARRRSPTWNAVEIELVEDQLEILGRYAQTLRRRSRSRPRPPRAGA